MRFESGTTMDINPKEEVEYCKLCNKKNKSYTCPRCGIGYCSLDCYKSEAHLECAESFYKQCVEEELKSSENDPEARQKMLDILKRLHEEDLENNILEESDDEEELDSDDEENLLDLETRLKDIDLDNPDQVWAILSDAEKQEFEALVKSGEASKLLPPWVPWWTTHKKPLIESLEITEEDKHDRHETEYPVIIDVQSFNEQMVVSPKIRFNIMNVIYAYTYIALYYNGDYLNCTEEAANTFLGICENMKEKKIFDNEETALESVVQNIKQKEYLSKDVETLSAFAEAGNSILKNTKRILGIKHMCAALSELWRLLSAVQKEMTVNKHKATEKQLSTKYTQHAMLNKNTSEMECSSSEDEISIKALKEATDVDFLKPALFSTQKNTEASESNQNSNNTNIKSLRKKVLEEDENFYNFGVTATFKSYVAKKLNTLLNRTIQLDDEANSKTSNIIANKDKSNGNYGVKLLSSSRDLLVTNEDVIVEPTNHKKRKKNIKEVTNVSHFREAAIDPERILSKVETEAWTERHKGSVFKYKKLKNGTLIEQN